MNSCQVGLGLAVFKKSSDPQMKFFILCNLQIVVHLDPFGQMREDGLPERITADSQNVRKRVIWPLGLTLVVFLSLFLIVSQIYLRRDLTRRIDDHIAAVDRLYQDHLDQRSTVMQTLIRQVKKNPALQNAMALRNRGALLEGSLPLFRDLLREQNITHFYYHQPDGTNFLRVHKPAFFGDRIERVTMQQARANQDLAAGVELGPLGTLTLRVVVPWFEGNEVIGYIEFGEEVEPLLDRVSSQTNSQMAILVNKNLLEKENWQAGQEMLGRSVRWDNLSDHVITATTAETLREVIHRFAAPAYFSGNELVDIRLQQQAFRGRFLPLTDAGGQRAGLLLVLHNVHGTLNDYQTSMLLVVLFCLMLGGTLFVSAYGILGRTEQVLHRARQSLLDEIAKTRQANTRLNKEIKERHAAEKALQEARDHLEQRVHERTSELDRQKKLLENLIGNIPFYVAWKDLDGTYIDCNIGFARLAGVRKSEIAGKHDNDLQWSTSLCRFLVEVDNEVLEKDQPVVGRELRDETAEGEIFYLCNAVPLRDADGRVFGTVCILQDITERKFRQRLLEKTLVEVRQARDRVLGVMRSVDDALLVIDADDKILLINETAGNLFRLNPGEMIGRDAVSVIPEGPLRDKVTGILRQRQGGQEFDFEIGNSSQVSPTVMQVRTSVLLDPHGRYEGMIFLGRDVTRDRSMDRLKSDFISVAAHELRTPLATILGFAELLVDDKAPTEEDRREFLRLIFEKAESLSRLLDDLLDISRIESGRGIDLINEQISAADLFLPIIRQYQKRVSQRRFSVDLEDPDALLSADPDKIGQVMENLLSNAVKYSEAEQTIEIAGRQVEDGYRLTINDPGIGMTPEQASHAFDKFYRGDNADKAIKGTGIGLTIVKHIVEAHQGRTWLESKLGQGTRVHVILPAA